jgi:hypothetical protein
VSAYISIAPSHQAALKVSEARAVSAVQLQFHVQRPTLFEIHGGSDIPKLS